MNTLVLTHEYFGAEACFAASKKLKNDGTSSFAPSDLRADAEVGAIAKPYKALMKAQRAVTAQVMASNGWAEKCTHTDWTYIMFMITCAKASLCAQSM